MIFNRDILRPDFTCVSPQFKNKFPKMNRDEFCDYIDRWKAYLVNECGLYKGSIVVNAMVVGDPDHFAFFFACAELGIKHAAPNYPYMDEFMDISNIKRLKIDAVFNDEVSKGYYHQSTVLQIVGDIITEGGGKTYWQGDVDIFSYDKPQSRPDPVITPDDVLQISYTRGRSGENVKLCNITHEWAMAVGARNAKVFSLANTLAIHTNNLHHAGSLTTYFIPTLLTCDEHRFYNIPNNTLYWAPEMSESLQKDFAREEDKVLLVQSTHVMKELKKRFTFVNSSFIHHRVSEYSETDGPLCLFVDNKLPDDFYQVHIMDDGTTLVKCDYFDWHVLDDKFEKVGDEYRIIGRRSEHKRTDFVKDRLNHPFEILTKEGRTYLVIFSTEEVTVPEQVRNMFDDVRTIHPNAFTSDDSRQWWGLKEMFHRAQYPATDWDYWEKRRIKGTDSLDILVQL